MTLGVIDE
jgi:hypothetical protein